MINETNYSAHAIEALRGYANRFSNLILSDDSKENCRRMIVRNSLGLADAIENSVKFRFPDRGRILNIDDRKMQDFISDRCKPFRLPYPCIAIEYQFESPSDPAHFMEFERSSSQRVAVAMEVEVTGRPGILVWGANHVDRSDQTRMGFINSEWLFDDYQVTLFEDGTCLAASVLDEARGDFMTPLMSAIDSSGLSRTELACRDMQSEISAVMQLIAALSCKNVSTKEIVPSLKLNKKRERSGKIPFFSYHVLEIPGCDDGVRSKNGGSHASPRIHLRRGHIRIHATAGRIWVNASVVGNKRLGVVSKDYRVAPLAEASL